MSELKKDPKVFALKTMHKLNGIVFEISDVNANMINLVISKKKNRYVRFIAFGDMAKKVKEQFKIKDRIKIRFYATSKKYGERWYTDLVVYEVSVWKKNEKKLAIQASLFKAEEEAKYLKPQKFDWQKEMEDFNNASEKKK